MTLTLNEEEIRIVFAAMLAMVHNIHDAQEDLTDWQWELAEGLYDMLLDYVEGRVLS